MVYKASNLLKPPAMSLEVEFFRAPFRSVRALLAGWAVAAALTASVAPAQAQAPTKPDAPQAAPQAVPGFWDPRRRPDRPDLSRITVIRFLTETDYPPFNFTGADGNPAGFNVDLARALCDEIKVSCTIQMRRFETLVESINANRGDAVIASIVPTAEVRAQADFTDPYYRVPARFVARRDGLALRGWRRGCRRLYGLGARERRREKRERQSGNGERTSH